MPFWNANQFDLNDPNNNEIWGGSPALQQEIHLPGTLGIAGAFGAQQGMLTPGIVPGVGPETILPWVPDLVGKVWQKKAAVFVVGSAYAGFIKEYSGRSANMNLCCYATANSASQFQERFLKDVVQPDEDYYGNLALLFDQIRTAEQLCILDLCRASFVRRGLQNGQQGGLDQSGDGVVRSSVAGPPPHSFQQYVDLNSNRTWQRLKKSKASKIVALGSIAEHGILRLFHQNGFTIREQGQPNPIHLPVFEANNARWVTLYAANDRRLGFWLQHQTWWSVTHPDPGQRTFHLLPIYHPARMSQYDPAYQLTRGLLLNFLAA